MITWYYWSKTHRLKWLCLLKSKLANESHNSKEMRDETVPGSTMRNGLHQIPIGQTVYSKSPQAEMQTGKPF